MPLLNKEMEELGVKIFASWRRYSHYVVQYLVPDSDEILMKVSEILKVWPPGMVEFCLPGDEVESVEHFSDRDFIGRQIEGYQLVKCRAWYVNKNT